MIGGTWQAFSANKLFTLYGPGVKIIKKFTYVSSGAIDMSLGKYTTLLQHIHGW